MSSQILVRWRSIFLRKLSFRPPSLSFIFVVGSFIYYDHRHWLRLPLHNERNLPPAMLHTSCPRWQNRSSRPYNVKTTSSPPTLRSDNLPLRSERKLDDNRWIRSMSNSGGICRYQNWGHQQRCFPSVFGFFEIKGWLMVLDFDDLQTVVYRWWSIRRRGSFQTKITT